MTKDRALIISILKGGLPAFNAARRRDIKADDLFGEDVEVFKLFERYISKGRLPTLEEIAIFAKVIILPHDGPIDFDICAKEITTRTLIRTLNDGFGPIGDKITVDPETARKDMVELVRKTAMSHGRIRETNSQDTIDEVLNRYITAEAAKGGLLGLSSPWPSLDEKSLGLQKGELHVIFARRKVGKTNCALAWLEHIWGKDLKAGESAMIVSMEMPPWQINQRVFANRNKLDYELFRSGKLLPDDRRRFFEWCEEMKRYDPTRPNLITVGSDICREISDIQGIAAQFNPKIILIDGFYILGRSSKKAKWERTLENAEGLKLDLCATLDIPVLATTQLGASVGKNELDADSDAAAFAKGISDYVDAGYGLFTDDVFKSEEKRVLRVMDARDFKPISLLINFSLKRQDFSQIKLLDDDKDIEIDGKPVTDLGNLPDFEEGAQLKF